MDDSQQNIFATCIVYGELGILLRGESGAGKSLLALDLLDRAEIRGFDAFLVSDDRVILDVNEDGLIASAPANISGQIELRGCGVIERPTVHQTQIHLLIDLVDVVDRMPENEEFEMELQGVKIARCPVPNRELIDSVHQRLLVIEAMKRVRKTL